MGFREFDDIRARVVGPSRYLGSEVNAVKKPRDAVKLRIALAFPDLYDIGTSHFGLQILYHILNQDPDIIAERVFAPALDMSAALRREGRLLFSLETQSPVRQFDIIGFSLLYELNYTNVLAMLDLGGIPFRSGERDDACPLIIAGGPCTCNPEPMAEFFDAMVVGDGESVIVEMARAWINWRQGSDKRKSALLEAWAAVEGVYIPSFFEPCWDGNGFMDLVPKVSWYNSVTRSVVPDLDQALFPGKPIVPFGRPIHDRLRIEVARGCSRGCRFCQAGMIYRPVRERSLEALKQLTSQALAATGYDDVSLLSLSTGDYSCLTSLMQELLFSHRSDPVAVSLPSFRAGTLSQEMMALVRKVRKTGFTIAPEAGSERLRRVINKNITETEILDTVGHAFSLGWRVIKLYFMIGLPTETEADIDAIVELVKKIRRKRGLAGKNAKINVSVATFIPKPHTPFQWQAQMPLSKASATIAGLHRRLKMPGVQFKWQRAEVSQIEGLWARGDRRLAALLETAYRKGCQFDGWSDSFDHDTWLAACRESGIDTDFFIYRPRAFSEPLPWDHIDCRIHKSFLWRELENSFDEVFTPDCRFGTCSGCGACDFSSVRPRLATEKTCFEDRPVDFDNGGIESDVEIRLRMRYAKLGSAKYFGQLELVQIFIRALRRSGIKMRYSRGFHPKPKISFHEALPVGIESRQEEFYLNVETAPDCDGVVLSINRQLPEGLSLLDCCRVPMKTGPGAELDHYYHIYRTDGDFDDSALNRFFAAESWIIQRRSRTHQVFEMDLKAVVSDIRSLSPGHLFVHLVPAAGRRLRPGETVQSIFGLPSDAVRCLRIVKVPAENAGLVH